MMSWVREEKTVAGSGQKGRHRQLLLLAQLMITAGLLYLAFRGVDLSAALNRVRSTPLSSVMLCFLLLAVQLLMLAWRWHVLLAFFGCEVGPLVLARGILAERLVNQLVPSTLGGDSARLVTLVGDSVSRGPSFLSVLFDRVSGILGIVIFVGLVSPLAILYGTGPRVALMPAVLAVSAVLATLAAACTPRPLLSRVVGLFRSQLLSRLAETSHELLRTSNFYFATAFISILVQILSCAVFVVIAVGLLGTASLGAVAVCAPIILLATAVPLTVAGWGLRESVSVALLEHVGIDAEDALGIAILYGLIQLLTGLFAGLVLLGLQIGQSLQRQRLLQPERDGNDRAK